MVNDDDLNDIANRYIHIWQENFAKTMADPKITASFMQAINNMQQFYDKSATSAFTDSFKSGFAQPNGGELSARVIELEQRVTELEKIIAGRPSKAKTKNPTKCKPKAK
jgi:hypothetical protein